MCYVILVHLLPLLIPPSDLTRRPASLRDARQLQHIALRHLQHQVLLRQSQFKISLPLLPRTLTEDLGLTGRYQNGQLGKARSDCSGLTPRPHLHGEH